MITHKKAISKLLRALMRSSSKTENDTYHHIHDDKSFPDIARGPKQQYNQGRLFRLSTIYVLNRTC